MEAIGADTIGGKDRKPLTESSQEATGAVESVMGAIEAVSKATPLDSLDPEEDAMGALKNVKKCCGIFLKNGGTDAGSASVERTWHTQDSRGHILSLAFRSKSSKLLSLKSPRIFQVLTPLSCSLFARKRTS